MKRFACQDIIPGCDHVFTGADDQSVLDQVIAHAAVDHGLVKPPLALVELVVATTHTYNPPRSRGHLRLVGQHTAPAQDTPSPVDREPDVDPAKRQAVAEDGGGRVVSISGEPFVRTADCDPAAGQVHAAYRHECLLYRGTEEFLAGTVPFIREGIALGQPILLAIAEPRQQALRDALGDDATRVVFADMTEFRNPARIIPALQDYISAMAGRPTRGVGEPIWAGRRAAEITESQLHESLMDVALDPDAPFWALCPYDVSALDETVISEAHRSHASVVTARTSTASPTFGGGEHASRLFATRLPEPAGPITSLRFGRDRRDQIAARVMKYAGRSGLPAQRCAKLAVAVNEIAMASSPSPDGDVRIRLWQDDVAVLCQVEGAGVIDDPLVGRRAARTGTPDDRGIRLANELCDLVQVRSNDAGTAVRVHALR